jgi:hypothetical protein
MQDKDSLSHFFSELAEDKDSLVLGILFGGVNRLHCLSEAYKLLLSNELKELTILTNSHLKELPSKEMALSKWLIKELNPNLSKLYLDCLDGKLHSGLKLITFAGEKGQSQYVSNHFECRPHEIESCWKNSNADYNFVLTSQSTDHSTSIIEAPSFLNDLFSSYYTGETTTPFISIELKDEHKEKSNIRIPKSSFIKSHKILATAYKVPQKSKSSLRDYVLIKKLIDKLPQKGHLIWQQGQWSEILKKELLLSTKSYSLLTSTLCESQLQLVKHWDNSQPSFSNAKLQELFITKKLDLEINENTIDVLLENRLVSSFLLKKDFEFLQNIGVFKTDNSISYRDGSIYNEKGESFSCDLGNTENKNSLIKLCLGKKWKDIFSCRYLNSQSLVSTDYITQISSKNFSDHLLNSDSIKLIKASSISLNGSFYAKDFDYSPHIEGKGKRYIFLKSSFNEKGELVNCINYEIKDNSFKLTQDDIIITEYGIIDLKNLDLNQRTLALISLADARFQEGLLRKAKIKNHVYNDSELTDKFFENDEEYLSHLYATEFEKKYGEQDSLEILDDVLKWYNSKFKVGIIGFFHLFCSIIFKQDKANIHNLKITKPSRGAFSKLFYRMFVYSLDKSRDLPNI